MPQSPPASPSAASQAITRIDRFARQAPAMLARLMGAADDAVDERLRRLLGESYASRMGRVPLSLGSSGVDPFGLDPEWMKYVILAIATMHRKYFRTEVHGIGNVPSGRVLFIANHSGQLPIDGALIAAALFMDAEPPRLVRAMVEKWAVSLPFVSLFFARVGQVVGVPENATRLLAQGEALLVFPEGVRGISKTFDQRYKLTEFGLGFMRLAIETDTPIVPVAVVGGEEQYISVANMEGLARLLRAPAFPIIPQIFLPGGQLPLPTKYRLWFGEPMRFSGDPDDDDGVIEEKVWLVKQTVQSMLNRALKERKHIFW
ncbi:MAG TPA: lysophospholipid acyltransferase family protein [Polyangiaceae bacterium]|nr:lysophospholipid acyltransferase family protein [Polyangiaceae bacterium]